MTNNSGEQIKNPNENATETNELDEHDEDEDSWDEDFVAESPTAIESSFVKRNRARHIQQQQMYRDAALKQKQQQLTSMAENTNNMITTTTTIAANVTTTKMVTAPQQPPTSMQLPWSQQPIHFPVPKSQPSSSSTIQSADLTSMMSRMALASSKTVSSGLIGDLDMAQQQQHQHIETPKFVLQSSAPVITCKPSNVIPSQPPVLSQPPPGTMSVAYAFINTQSSKQFVNPVATTTTTTNTNNTVMPTAPAANLNNPPRFLMSTGAAVAPGAPSMPGYYQFLQASTVPSPQPQPQPIVTQAQPPSVMMPATHGYHNHHHHHQLHQQHHHLLPNSPSSPIISDSIHRMYAATAVSDVVQRLKSVNTSPQESVCSHRSAMSTLSIVKNDNIQCTADRFTALLNKANMVNIIFLLEISF